VLLVHRCALGGAIHLAGGDEDEALDGRTANRVEQDLRALHVRRHELGRALLDRLLHVRLGRGVDDHVHLGHHLGDELGVADVAVHEREPLVGDHVGEVLQVARVGERVQRDDLVARVGEQVPDEVGRDEPGAAGDENALLPQNQSSLSIE
jgi:hypothetical protein